MAYAKPHKKAYFAVNSAYFEFNLSRNFLLAIFGHQPILRRL